jgi:hypothetical protein
MIIVLSPGNIQCQPAVYRKTRAVELGPKINIMLDLQGVYQLRCPSSKGNASTYLYVNNINEVLYFLIIYFMGKS